MDIKRNVSVLQYNTFGIDVNAKYLASFKNEEDLKEILLSEEGKEKHQLILGGGSNILFTEDFDGLIIKNEIKGIEVIKETNDHVFVKAGAGENWHSFVLHCISNGYAGIENLSLIPGNVGASPMQNIGAYGVEIKDVFHELEAINRRTGDKQVFDNESCKFGYRESVFKNEYRNHFVITSVTYRLNKTHQFNVSYGAIEKQLQKNGVKELSLKAVSDAIIQIRESKLPNPKEIGNAGSFFKNPVITKDQFDRIKGNFKGIAHYQLPNGDIKLAAGWLIDHLGWKGKTIKNYGVHKNQALVLVNYDDASGSDIYNLSSEIIASVKEKTGITLEREVNIY